MRVLAMFFAVALLASCAPTSPLPEQHWVTRYYDRNHDGIVDFEIHTLGRGHHDAAWALSDTKFSGRYDQRVHWGIVLEKTRVDIAVPKNVPITPGRPPASETQ